MGNFQSQKSRVFCAVAFAGACAFGGGVYVWNGGSSGDWNAAANWTVDGETATAAPGAGDVAQFDAAATITSGVAIGEGTLTISNAAADVHLNGVVSGAGGIFKGGAGALHLHGDNSFEGTFVSIGTKDCTWKSSGGRAGHSGEVYVYHTNALGRTSAAFDPDYAKGHGSQLVIDGTSFPDFVVPIPVTLTGDNEDSGNLQVNNCTSLTFSEVLSSPDRFRFHADKTFTLNYMKGARPGGGYCVIMTPTHYYGPHIGSGRFYLNGSEVAYFHAGGNQYADLQMCAQSKVYCSAADALDPDDELILAAGTVKDPTLIDLGGFDQTYTCKTAMSLPTSGGTVAFASAAPAAMRFSGAIAAQPAVTAIFTGMAGLEWNPDDATSEFEFSNVVQTTAGSFAVTRGTLRMKCGAGFSNLGALSVADGAAFAVDADAGETFVTNVAVAVGGKIKIGAGKSLVCRSCKVGGEDVGEGTWTSANCPDFIEGDGTLFVYPRDVSLWIGGASGDWNDAANWNVGEAPKEGWRVKLAGAVRVTLTNATPRLAEFRLADGATLVFSNSWNACLAADAVSIDSSTVTCGGPFTNENAKCRVWFKCGTFEMDAKSLIDLDGKGWKGGQYNTAGLNPSTDWNPNTPVKNEDGFDNGGYGPGRSNGQFGASHLGLCGVRNYTAFNHGNNVFSDVFKDVYDDPFAPVEPGSGGRGVTASAYSQAWSAIGSGGGAAFIDATGDVRIDGKIHASGLSSTVNSWFLENAVSACNGPGAGGAVFVKCATVSGAGEIVADGGNGNYGNVKSAFDSNGKDCVTAAGGGGVAIVCTGGQTAAAVAGMKVSAAGGHYVLNNGLDWATMDDCGIGAEPGTVYFSSPALVDAMIGRGLCGRLVGFASYTYDGDLDWTWGHVRFATTGVTFNVTGNLTLSGGWSRLDVGGVHKRMYWARTPYVSAGDEKVTMNVGGDCVVSNGAAMFVYAAEVPGEETWGADVAVGGEFRIGDGGTLHPVSDFGYGGAPHFTAASFALAEGGKVDADHAGGSGAWNSGTYSVCYPGGSHGNGVGVGAGRNAHVSASHGGAGKVSYKDGAAYPGFSAPATNDNPVCPRFSGAGGSSGGYSAAGDGGGVFHLVCVGAVELDGEISANGRAPDYVSAGSMYYLGSGAGGSVYLEGATLAAGANAKISARGGDSYVVKAGEATACGGGGRVAFKAVKGGGDMFTTRYSEDGAAKRLKGAFADFAPAIDVGGGTNEVRTAGVDPIPETYGDDGTAWYGATVRLPGTAVIVR